MRFRGLMKILEKFPPFSLFLFFSRPNLGAIAFDVTVNYEIVQQAAQERHFPARTFLAEFFLVFSSQHYRSPTQLPTLRTSPSE